MKEIKKITKQTPATGIKGMLLDYGMTFRVSYGKPEKDGDSWYKDYDICHPDMLVEIIDKDAFMYEDEAGNAYIDMGLVGELANKLCDKETK